MSRRSNEEDDEKSFVDVAVFGWPRVPGLWSNTRKLPEFFLTYDPAPTKRRVKTPVMIRADVLEVITDWLAQRLR